MLWYVEDMGNVATHYDKGSCGSQRALGFSIVEVKWNLTLATKQVRPSAMQ
jgi:hypothetical protein